MLVWLDRLELLIRPVVNVRALGERQVLFDWPTGRGMGLGALVSAESVMEHTEAIAELEKITSQMEEIG